MTYTVNYTDPNKDPIIIPQKTADTSTSLQLLGREYSRWGELLAENLLALLENFAYDSAPSNPVAGQLWHDTGLDILKFYTGSEWLPVSGMFVDENEPSQTVSTGDLWTDADSGDVYVRYNNEWIFIGGPERKTRVSRDQFREDTGGTVHPTLEFLVDDKIVALISVSGPWTPASTEKDPSGADLTDTFSTVDKGINLTSETDFKFRGTATSAEYADLAERYAIDISSGPGTVVMIGGEKEVTPTVDEGSTEVFGIVRDERYVGFGMNAYVGTQETHPMIALVGRVPCKVVGPVKKGERLVSSSTPGHARAATPEESTETLKVIGRSLENKNTDEAGVIEVTIGMK